jgi:hypothetical protein
MNNLSDLVDIVIGVDTHLLTHTATVVGLLQLRKHSAG